MVIVVHLCFRTPDAQLLALFTLTVKASPLIPIECTSGFEVLLHFFLLVCSPYFSKDFLRSCFCRTFRRFLRRSTGSGLGRSSHEICPSLTWEAQSYEKTAVNELKICFNLLGNVTMRPSAHFHTQTQQSHRACSFQLFPRRRTSCSPEGIGILSKVSASPPATCSQTSGQIGSHWR